jgi:cold-inducible RNA-binding protein
MSRKLFVGNLSYNTTEDSLEGLFTQVGAVESARVMRDMATGRSRGFGFVEMQSEDDARTAIERFNDTELDGRRIAVNVAQPKPSGGGAGGRGGFGGPRRREPRW